MERYIRWGMGVSQPRRERSDPNNRDPGKALLGWLFPVACQVLHLLRLLFFLAHHSQASGFLCMDAAVIRHQVPLCEGTTTSCPKAPEYLILGGLCKFESVHLRHIFPKIPLETLAINDTNVKQIDYYPT